MREGGYMGWWEERAGVEDGLCPRALVGGGFIRFGGNLDLVSGGARGLIETALTVSTPAGLQGLRPFVADSLVKRIGRTWRGSNWPLRLAK